MEDKKMGMLVAREDPISIGVLLFPPLPASPPPPKCSNKAATHFSHIAYVVP